ncbi:MAG: hypothetical protein R3272_08555 [Candidatus Promineifilaceae bacterium]|nr:hypothetical protein [Candidatus Promineifilaceae bacterium]
MANRGCSVLFKILTVAVVGMIVLVLLGLVLLLAVPDVVTSLGEPLGFSVPVREAESVVAPSPTLALVAALPTSTATRAGQVVATWTPQPAAAAAVATATNTRRPTGVPSITPTFPPRTPTPTPTNTATPTDTPSPTPTPGPSLTPTNTRSAFLFTKSDESPNYTSNYANAAGCDWLGIAGGVTNVRGNPVTGGQYQVHVWGCGVDVRTLAGSAPAYSTHGAGYEVYLFNEPVTRTCNVQLETSNGSAVSQVYTIQTGNACNTNLTLFNFVQNR